MTEGIHKNVCETRNKVPNETLILSADKGSDIVVLELDNDDKNTQIKIKASTIVEKTKPNTEKSSSFKATRDSFSVPYIKKKK